MPDKNFKTPLLPRRNSSSLSNYSVPSSSDKYNQNVSIKKPENLI